MGLVPTSQNGFGANDRSVIRSALIPGSDVKVAVRRGPAGDVLLAAAARWHREVEPLRAPDGVLDCWGFAERKIRGSATTLSNHASGTALDFRARAHPLGVTKTRTYNAAQIAAAHRIVDDFRPALRWGGDYDDPARGGVRGSRPDPMHLEVNASEAACAAALARQGGSPSPTPSAPSTPPKPKGLPEMIERPLVKGLNEGRVVCPTGSVSGIVGAAWASVSLTGGGRVQLWFQRGARHDGPAPGAGAPVDWTVMNAERPWAVVPDGTEFIDYRITADGPGSLLVEQRAK